MHVQHLCEGFDHAFNWEQYASGGGYYFPTIKVGPRAHPSITSVAQPTLLFYSMWGYYLPTGL